MITNKKAQDWCTPALPFQTFHREYRFTCDGAASLLNHKLPYYWTEAHDALSRSWAGHRVFWNPPFSDVGAWLAHAIEQRDRYGVFSVGLALCSLETDWYLDLASKVEKHTFRRRVAYEPPRGVEKSSPSFPSVLLICNPDRPTYGNGDLFTRRRSAVTGEYVD